jgi:hypothetical protein
MRRSLAVDRLRSLSLPGLRVGALDASRRVGDAGQRRCSIVWPSRNLPLLTDLPAQSCDQLASSLSAQVELGSNAGVRRRVHKAVDVDFDVLGGPCFCAPGFLESEQVLDALRGASAHRAPVPALKWRRGRNGQQPYSLCNPEQSPPDLERTSLQWLNLRNIHPTPHHCLVQPTARAA